MRQWNGLRLGDTVYYNNDKTRQYIVKDLYEKDKERMCKVESSEGDILEVSVYLCEKVKTNFF